MLALVAVLAGLSAAASAATTDCTAQPVGYGPVPSPNTDTAFKAYAPFATAAKNAATPSLYQRTFVNLNASELGTASNVYMGYYELKAYDPASCTAICDTTSGCVGTNLYFERDPSLAPAAACPNPAALTVIKCALWGSPVTAVDATNDGQYQENFHVLIAGSNGYMKLPSQACSAISSAWSGDAYAWPSSAVNWQGWTSIFGSRITSAAWPSSATAGVRGW
ncbi:hypothetical protein LTR36_002943 [Oleoguttula mirabilis]|uniref:Uncharacterized protein n=1 Tax=Oleoguttula mirabilis TaxID=1507867 RepID=A0AAV9JK11_9PEZI|nr:hypothetical protein LTR36_002943 [Oleoguttula mirabilis]